MAAKVTMKKKRDNETTDREQLVQRRFMENDLDPGRDAELGWIDKAEDAEAESAAELNGNPFGAGGSKRRED